MGLLVGASMKAEKLICKELRVPRAPPLAPGWKSFRRPVSIGYIILSSESSPRGLRIRGEEDDTRVDKEID